MTNFLNILFSCGKGIKVTQKVCIEPKYGGFACPKGEMIAKQAPCTGKNICSNLLIFNITHLSFLLTFSNLLNL